MTPYFQFVNDRLYFDINGCCYPCFSCKDCARHFISAVRTMPYPYSGKTVVSGTLGDKTMDDKLMYTRYLNMLNKIIPNEIISVKVLTLIVCTTIS